MEEKGIRTEIGEYNRRIKEHNSALSSLRRLLTDLSAWLKSVVRKISEFTEKEAPQPTILDFVNARRLPLLPTSVFASTTSER